MLNFIYQSFYLCWRFWISWSPPYCAVFVIIIAMHSRTGWERTSPNSTTLKRWSWRLSAAGECLSWAVWPWTVMETVSSRWVFVLSSVTLNSHGDSAAGEYPEQLDLDQSQRLSAAGECPEQLDLDQSRRLSAAGECPEQLDLDQSRRLSAAGECPEQLDLDQSRRLSAAGECPEQLDLDQSWRLSAAGECPEQLDLDQSRGLSAAGECPEQLDLDQSRRLSAAGECSEQWDCDFEETHKETSQQVSICPEQCDLEQSWRLASRSVFVLSSVTLNSHANKPADESVLNSETFNKWLWKLYRKQLNNPPDQESFFCL